MSTAANKILYVVIGTVILVAGIIGIFIALFIPVLLVFKNLSGDALTIVIAVLTIISFGISSLIYKKLIKVIARALRIDELTPRDGLDKP